MTTQINRRTVVKGAAWSVPAITVASASPAFAASPQTAAGTGNLYFVVDTPPSFLRGYSHILFNTVPTPELVAGSQIPGGNSSPTCNAEDNSTNRSGFWLTGNSYVVDPSFTTTITVEGLQSNVQVVEWGTLQGSDRFVDQGEIVTQDSMEDYTAIGDWNGSFTVTVTSVTNSGAGAEEKTVVVLDSVGTGMVGGTTAYCGHGQLVQNPLPTLNVRGNTVTVTMCLTGPDEGGTTRAYNYAPGSTTPNPATDAEVPLSSLFNGETCLTATLVDGQDSYTEPQGS